MPTELSIRFTAADDAAPISVALFRPDAGAGGVVGQRRSHDRERLVLRGGARRTGLGCAHAAI